MSGGKSADCSSVEYLMATSSNYIAGGGISKTSVTRQDAFILMSVHKKEALESTSLVLH
jgi:hypothetical protein